MENHDYDTKSTDDTSSKNEDEPSYHEDILTEESLDDGNDGSTLSKDEKAAKVIRHRKRKIYNQVRGQMEFYFSDSNLLKDRYLMQLIRKDEFVPLDTFLNFNKIRKLIKTSSELIKALSTSSELALNDDKTHVRRIKPLPNPDENQEEIEARTIYVESLPANADHEWVKKVFQHITNGGKVAYVSLPRYKKTKKLKEFGFVEFETQECVEKCLKAFEKFDGILHIDAFDPSNLVSVKSFLKEQSMDDIGKKFSTQKTVSKIIKNVDQEKTNKLTETIAKKKLNTSDEESEIDNSKIKSNRQKLNEDNHDFTSNKISQSEDDTASDESAGFEKVGKKKKTRKRKKRDKKKSKTIERTNVISKESEVQKLQQRPLNLDVDLKDLKILPKRDWKRLRNKYLNLQREKINSLKKKNWANLKTNIAKKQVAAVKHIGRLNQQIAAAATATSVQNNHTGVVTNISSSSIGAKSIIQQTAKSSQESPNTNLTVTNVKNFDLKKSPHMNFYRVNKEIDGGLYDDDENDSQSNDASSLDSPGLNSPYSMLEKRRKLLSPITNSTKTEIKRNTSCGVTLEKSPLFQFQPGIICKLELQSPCITVKQLKNDLKQQNDTIKYIDIKEGSNLIYLRFDTANSAQQFHKDYPQIKENEIKKCVVLEGTEESKYWDKIMEDRDMKLNKRIKVKTRRGREKAQKLIATHIRFTEVDI